MMRCGVLSATAAFMVGIAGATGAEAASVFLLDRSDRLADGPGYLQVTIEDGADGAIDFTLQALAPLVARAGDRLEIRAFAFNVAEGLDISTANVAGLPQGWSARGTSRLDGFGRFDVTLIGTGPERRDSLQFSIVGIEGDSPLSYAIPSTGNAGEDNAAFAVRVRDLLAATECDPDRKCTPRAIPTAFIGGGSEVPLPAGGWLALTAVMAAARFSRRRRAGGCR